MSEQDWYSILACPRDPERPPLRYETWPSDGREWLICTQCRFGYPIEDGIPNLLPESAVAPQELAKMRGAE
jgi:uncharacterized protein YbaR (Trm112 family)